MVNPPCTDGGRGPPFYAPLTVGGLCPRAVTPTCPRVSGDRLPEVVNRGRGTSAVHCLGLLFELLPLQLILFVLFGLLPLQLILSWQLKPR